MSNDINIMVHSYCSQLILKNNKDKRKIIKKVVREDSPLIIEASC